MDNICSLCNNQLSDIYTLLSCNHKFCFNCINAWRITHRICPTCQQQITSSRRQLSRTYALSGIVLCQGHQGITYAFSAQSSQGGQT